MIPRWLKSLCRSDRGTALIESAIVLPVFLLLVGGIFEFGFTDAILQMWAAFCDELAHGRAKMRQPFYCATPEETHQSHLIFTQALASAL